MHRTDHKAIPLARSGRPGDDDIPGLPAQAHARPNMGQSRICRVSPSRRPRQESHGKDNNRMRTENGSF